MSLLGACAWLLSHIQLFGTLWTVAHQAPLWYLSGKNTEVGHHLPSPGDLRDPRIELLSPKVKVLVTQSHSTLCDPMNCVVQPGSSVHRFLQAKIMEWVQFSSVQFSSQSCLTLYDPMNCSMPSLLVHHQLPEIIQTHVY